MNPDSPCSPVVSSFVLAEMSDKTSLATLTLASDHDWAGVWIGSTLGFVTSLSLWWPAQQFQAQNCGMPSMLALRVW